jgi:hypothetical protein
MDKQDRLNELTDKYFSGEIELEDFLEERRRYSLDFGALVSDIAANRTKRDSKSDDPPPAHLHQVLRSFEKREGMFLTALRKVLGTR